MLSSTCCARKSTSSCEFWLPPPTDDPPTLVKSDPPTAAQRQAVRRALSKLQKRGLAVKLGNMFHGERCSYADREHALAIVRKDVQHFGLQSLRHYPRRVQELYADEIAGEA